LYGLHSFQFSVFLFFLTYTKFHRRLQG
jgi:hypothetical protein